MSTEASSPAEGEFAASADEHYDVMGVPVSAVNRPLAVERIARWIAEGERHYVCIRDAHGVIRAQTDAELMAIHHEAGMVTPDGMPIVWAGRKAGFPDVDRVYGPDLVEDLAEQAAVDGWSIFYYGGNDGVADAFATAFEQRFPGLKSAGTFCPPFRDLTADEKRDVAKMINDSGADIVLVGLSTPKQEKWMAEMRPSLTAAALLGVGAAFDFHTGSVRQAPKWIQRSGLEWLFRVGMEPKRLAKRYFVVVPRFAIGILRNRPHRIS
ncbi:MAG: WecB/TagA/CpsF family glycosyltransferase [Acidimicrobiales bacterium]